MKTAALVATVVVGANAAVDVKAMCNAATDLVGCIQPLITVAESASCQSLSQFTDAFQALKMDPAMLQPCEQYTGRRLLADEVEEFKDMVNLPRRLTETLGATGGTFGLDVLGEICTEDSCVPKLFGAMKGFPKCIDAPMKTIIAQLNEIMPGAGAGMNAGMEMLEPMIEKSGAVFRQVCTKNADGSYCMTLYSDFAALQSLNANQCDKALDMGCCLGTFPKIIDAGADMTGIAGQYTGADVQNLAKAICNWEALPPACVASGESRQVAAVKFGVAGVAISKWKALTPEQRQKIRAGIKQDIADKLGVPITSVDLGEIAGDETGLSITGDVVPSETSDAASVSAAFSGTVALPTAQAAMEAENVVAAGETITAADVTSSTVVEESAIDVDSGVGALSPSLLFAAALAVLVMN